MTCHWIRPNVRHIGILLLISILTISPLSTVCEILSKSDRSRQKKMTYCRFSTWRIYAILDFRGPIMGSLKSPCTTSYRSSIETIALNSLVFEKIAVLRDRTDKQMDRPIAWSRSRCGERRLTLGVRKISLLDITLANSNRSWLNLVNVRAQNFLNVIAPWPAYRRYIGQTGGGAMGCSDEPRAAGFCRQTKMTFWQLDNGRFSPNLATTCESTSPRWFSKGIFENFPFMGHCPQIPQTWIESNGHLTLTSLQPRGRTAERYCSLLVVQWPVFTARCYA